MKNILILVLSSIAIANAMEEKKEQTFEYWQQLPIELRGMILGHLPEISNYNDFKNLLTTSKEMSALVSQPEMRKKFVHSIASDIFKSIKNIDKAKKILLEAVKNNDTDLVEGLLLADANNALKGENNRALGYAVQQDNLAIVKLLLEHGADPRTPEGIRSIYKPPLYVAAENNNKDMANLLLKHGANINGDYNRITSLGIAAKNGNKELVELLLIRKADVNLPGPWESPLKLATEHGHEDIAQLLIEHGADVTAKSTPQEKESRENRSQFMQALSNNDNDLARKLLDTGINANELIDRNLPLVVAANRGNHEMVKLLLDKGADVNRPDIGGMGTGLAAAVLSGDLETVNLLIQHGANVNSVEPGAFTPLHRGAQSKNKEMVKILLDHGANLNAVTIDYRDTPLHLAIYDNAPEIVELLLNRGADASIRNRDGKDALEFAQQKGNKTIIDLIKSYFKPSTSGS